MSHPNFTLFLARHGETEYNRRRLMQGRSIDAGLNETGWTQAEALADRFREAELTAIYSSPLRRARETAGKVAALHELPLILDADLSEMSWGSLEGRPIAELSTHLAGIGTNWKAGEFEQRVGGGESILDVENRARRALQGILRPRVAGETVLVVTHGRFLRVMLTVALNLGLERMDEFGHANTGVYRLDYRHDRFQLAVKNSTAHLEPQEL